MNTGQLIRKHRLGIGATLEQVAFSAGMDASNLSRIERGMQQPSSALMKRIATALNLSVGQLFDAPDGSSNPANESHEYEPLLYGKDAQKMMRVFQQLNDHHRQLTLDFMKLLVKHQKVEF